MKKVYCEGIVPSELEESWEKIIVMREMENDQVPQVKKQLEEVRNLMKGSTGEKKAEAQAIELQLLALLDEHKHRLLEMGAAGRLLISGELEDMLPLDDADTLEKASPISPSGSVKNDPARIAARNDAQVRAVVKNGQVSVIILGGAHDLTGSIKRLGENCEYLRITTKRYKEIAE